MECMYAHIRYVCGVFFTGCLAGVMCLAYLLSDQMSQLLLVLSLPACGFNWVRSRFGPREAVAKKKVTKTMADSLFWAQIEHDLAPVTRPQHPGPSARISSRWSRQFTVTRPRDLLNQLAAVAPCTLAKGPITCRCSHRLRRMYT